MTSLEQQSVNTFLTALGSRSSTPGGGAVAALSAAQATALLLMVANFTRHHDSEIGQLKKDLPVWQANFLDLADADISAFNQVMASYKLPASTDQEQAFRQNSIQTALVEAARVPKKMLELIFSLIPVASRLLETGNRNLVTDTAIAASLLSSAIDACRLNLLINMKSMYPTTAAEFSPVFKQTEDAITTLNNIVSQVEHSLH